MSQNTHESLSALMDGESDELELRRVLKSLSNDSDSADTWRRYHLARSLMQRDKDIDVSVDLSAGIMARIQEEGVAQDAAVSADASPKPRKSSFSLARGAGIAATVSLMVITGVQYFSSGSDTLEQPDSVASSAPASVNATSSVNVTQQVQPVNLSSLSTSNAVINDVPVFEQTPFRMNGQTTSDGFMTVGQSGQSMPNVQPSSSMNIQSFAMDSEQLRLLQSYFEEHGQNLEQSGANNSWSAAASNAAQ